MSFNKVVIMGNLTRDPEVRTLPSGNSVARVSVAINRSYSDKDGNKKEEVTFVEVDAFGKQAELMGKFFTKGKAILVEGRLKLDQWTDKQTDEKKSRLGVVMEGFSFVGDGKGRDDGAGSDEPREPRRQRMGAAKPADADAVRRANDEDVPF